MLARTKLKLQGDRKAMDLDSVKAKLASLLCDKPRGSTADITEETVVCWNGERLLSIHLCADHPGFATCSTSTMTSAET
jgi:hypothetical protein